MATVYKVFYYHSLSIIGKNVMQRVFSQDFLGQNVLFTFILNNTVDITEIY